jgi:PAS domain S-box-containing protein
MSSRTGTSRAPTTLAPRGRAAERIGERLDNAVSRTGIGVWELDFRTDYAHWYSDWCNHLNLDPCEGARHVERWDSYIHPDDLIETRRRFRDHLAGHEDHYDAEYRILDRSLHWRWVFERGRVVERAADGTALRMVGACLDIDARKEAELELLRSRKRLEVALESAGGGMWDLDVQSGEPRQTEFFYRMLGVDSGVGSREPRFWSSRVHPEDMPRVREAIDRTVEGKQELYESEYRLRHADGTWRWVLDRGRATERDFLGRARRLVGFLVEITDRVQTQEALRRSEFRYRTVASMTPGYVFECRFDERGNIEPVWLSEGLQAVFGCTAEEYMVRGGWEHFVDPECQATADQHRGRVLAGLPQGGEVRIRTVDGQHKWLYSSSVPVRDPHTGAAVGFIGAAYDVTPNKLAEQERQSLEREIIHIANREQQRIGNDLHDGLGQDLTGIALMLRGVGAQLRKEGSAVCGDIEDVIALVNAAIESTRTLARGLSPVSAERGGLTAALEALAARATERYGIPVTFASAVSGPLPLDESAATHLYRIAQEALTNALRHSLATELCIRVTTTCTDLELSIEDNGRGFPRVALERHDGLGLKIMRYRAQMLGGDLTLEAGADGGARVRCCCPLGPGVRTACRGRGSAPRAPAQPGSSGRPPRR